jgi:hypothetical protein
MLSAQRDSVQLEANGESLGRGRPERGMELEAHFLLAHDMHAALEPAAVGRPMLLYANAIACTGVREVKTKALQD